MCSFQNIVLYYSTNIYWKENESSLFVMKLRARILIIKFVAGKS